jgi:hypothetical protein
MDAHSWRARGISLRTSASLKTSKCGHRHTRDMGGDVHPWRRVLGGELYGSAAPAGRPALRRQSSPQISSVYHWAGAARLAHRRRLAQQLRQLGEVHRHAPRLVARQPIWSPSDATQRYVRGIVIGAEHHSVRTTHLKGGSQSDWVEPHAVDQDGPPPHSPWLTPNKRDGRSLRSSALVREALQERPKSRSPNSRVRECHVTVAGRASWKHHLGVVRCGG